MLELAKTEVATGRDDFRTETLQGASANTRALIQGDFNDHPFKDADSGRLVNRGSDR